MDRTEITVRNMLQAIKAPLYDIGVLSSRGMLPGLDCISAEDVLKRLSLLKYRNARGSHIFVRPSGEHGYLSRDPSPSRRAAYIRRTMAKARRWVER